VKHTICIDTFGVGHEKATLQKRLFLANFLAINAKNIKLERSGNAATDYTSVAPIPAHIRSHLLTAIQVFLSAAYSTETVATFTKQYRAADVMGTLSATATA
jgi:hypothetical protein